MKAIRISVVLSMLRDAGWQVVRQKGSHRQLKHPNKKGTVTVNGKPSDDVWGFLLRSIEEQAGIKF